MSSDTRGYCGSAIQHKAAKDQISNTEYLCNDMNATVRQSGELLEGGPPHWLQRSLGLIKPGDPKIARRAELVVLVGWASLVVLAVAQTHHHRAGGSRPNPVRGAVDSVHR